MASAARILAVCLQTPGALPPLAWGGTGEAKTQALARIARDLGLFFRPVIPAVRFGPMDHTT